MQLIPKNTEDAITSLQTSWNKTVQSLLETAQLLLDYQKRDDWFQIKAELAARKIMKSEVLSMMMTIGRSQLLNELAYLDTLPGSYNSLYHLSKMDEGDLKTKLDSGDITPTTRLNEIRAFTKPKKTRVSPTTTSYSKRLIVSGNDYKQHKDDIDELLADISKNYPYISIK